MRQVFKGSMSHPGATGTNPPCVYPGSPQCLFTGVTPYNDDKDCRYAASSLQCHGARATMQRRMAATGTVLYKYTDEESGGGHNLDPRTRSSVSLAGTVWIMSMDHVLHEALPRTAIERFGPAASSPPSPPGPGPPTPPRLVAIPGNIVHRTYRERSRHVTPRHPSSRASIQKPPGIS